MKGRPGFSLVDLMVSLAVMAVVLTAVYTVFAFQSKAVQAAAEGRTVAAQGLFILDRLTRDLNGAWLPQPPVGPDSKYQYKFKADKYQLNFITTSSLSPVQTLGPELVEVGYRWETDPEGDGQKKLLLRRQQDSPDEDPESGGSEIVITRDLLSIEITYSKDAQVEESWSADSLPAAVSIRLALASPDGQEEVFLTIVELPLAMPVIKNFEMDLGDFDLG